MLLVVVCLLLTVGYVLLMAAYMVGWARQKTFVLPAGYEPITTISVVIPARNEAGNIALCIDAILAQNYPMHLLEIVVTDDHSEDDTATIVAGYAREGVKCISLSAHMGISGTIAYKKAAIAAGIANSTGQLIVTTDADCTAPRGWLRNIAAIYEQQQAVMVVAPVVYTGGSSVVELFQQIDFMSMQGITGAAYRLGLGNMCNGANLAFGRDAYEQVGGYVGVDHLASGDDYLLMMKISKAYAGRIAYLKSDEAIVQTPPQPGWGSFMQQRIRWASKSGKYDDRKMTAILGLVYLFNLSFAVLLVAGLFNNHYMCLAVGMLVIKTIVELIFLIPVARFFGAVGILLWFAMLQPLHIAYIISAGFFGFLGTYRWKGRTVK